MINKSKTAAGIKAAGEPKKISGRKNMLLYIAVTAVLICILLAFGSLKKGYHVDEMYTFGLSNHLNSLNDSIHIDFDNGTVYSGQELWDEYLTVKDGGRFDYANVYKNQEGDVHPPLYYIFIHTVSSIFPDLSLMWIGLLINVLFDIIIYWQMVWINRKMGLKKIASMILSAFYVLGAGFVGYAVVFFRMYALLAVWINFLVMIFLANKPEDKAGIKYYLSLGIVLLGGLLTQYYFMIFAFFACLVYAVFAVVSKNWKKLIFSIVTVAVTVGLWLLVWPAALKHIFSGYRGTEAIENMLTGSIRENLWSYLDQINSGIFGGLFLVILAVLLCLIVIDSNRASQNSKEIKYTKAYQYALLVIPVCFYVVIIAKIAPYNTLRYVISMSAPLYIAVFGAMMNMANRISNKAGAAIIILAALVLFGGYRNGIDNLNTAETEKTETISAYEESACLYLYDSKWRIYSNLLELKELDSIVFMKEDDWEEIVSGQAQQNESENVIVYISDYIDLDQTEVLTYIMEEYGLSESTQLFTSGYATCYVLE